MSATLTDALMALDRLVPSPMEAATGKYRRLTDDIAALLLDQHPERYNLEHMGGYASAIRRTPAIERLLYERQYRQTAAGQLIDSGYADGPEKSLAARIMMVGDPLGTLRCATDALDLARYRVAPALAAAPAHAATVVWLAWERLGGMLPQDDAEPSADLAPLIYLCQHRWPDICRDGRLPPAVADLVRRVADHCAYYLIDPTGVSSLTSDVRHARGWLDMWSAADEAEGPLLRREGVDGRACVHDDRRRPDGKRRRRSDLPAQQQALARIYYKRRRATHKLIRRRADVRARDDGTADGETREARPAIGGPRDPGFDDGDPRAARTGPARLLPIPPDAGQPLPLADAGVDDPGVPGPLLAPDPDAPGLAHGHYPDEQYASAQVSLDRHAALPGALLSSVVHALTEGYATPDDAPTTTLARWTATMLSLLLGLPAGQTASLHVGGAPHDDYPVYDPDAHVLHLPLGEDLHKAWRHPREDRWRYRAVEGALSVRLPPMVQRLLTRCHDRWPPPVASPDRPPAFVVGDRLPRPLHAADLDVMWAALGKRMGRNLSGGYMVAAWEALALDGGHVPPSALPCLCGQAMRWAVPATYLAPARADVDRWARLHVAYVRDQILDRAATLDIASGEVGGEHGVRATLARWLPADDADATTDAPRQGYVGTGYCLREDVVGEIVRTAIHRADVARLIAPTADARAAMATALGVVLHAFVGLRVQDVRRCRRLDLQDDVMPDGSRRYLLHVLMKPPGGGLPRPRALILPSALHRTVGYYCDTWPPGIDAEDPLVPANLPFPRADSCRHLIATHITADLERYADRLGMRTVDVAACLEWWLGHDIPGWAAADRRMALEMPAARLMDEVGVALADLYQIDII